MKEQINTTGSIEYNLKLYQMTQELKELKEKKEGLSFLEQLRTMPLDYSKAGQIFIQPTSATGSHKK
jgi:hypothetical protein